MARFEDKLMDGWTDGRVNDKVHRQIDGWKDGQIDE